MTDQENVKSKIAVDINLKGLLFAVILGFALYGLSIGIIRVHQYIRYNKVKYVITNPKGIVGNIVVTSDETQSFVYNSNLGRITQIRKKKIEYPKLGEIEPRRILNRDILTYQFKGQFHLYAEGLLSEGTHFDIYLNGKRIYGIKSLMGKLDFEYHIRVLKRGRDHWVVN